ncbi:DUF5996 family protein [Streptomyces sp. NPDC048825]|uniref:DUF5996 family protein n=1 Tax=Streptomyces sp. NPDC048825 TaxID=3365592 RepID=UPI003720EFA8
MAGEAEAPLAPGSAEWVARRGRHPAVLRYDAARAVAHPRAAVLTFYDSAYIRPQPGVPTGTWPGSPAPEA